jgi:hypothetical protein
LTNIPLPTYSKTALRLRTSTAEEINSYPNYVLIYIHQMIYPQLFACVAGIIYCVRHAPLRAAIAREVKARWDELKSLVT